MAKSGDDLMNELAALRKNRSGIDVKIREAEKALASWNADLDRDWKLLVGSASLAVAIKDRVSPASLSGYLSETMTVAEKTRHRDQLGALQALGDPPDAPADALNAAGPPDGGALSV